MRTALLAPAALAAAAALAACSASPSAQLLNAPTLAEHHAEIAGVPTTVRIVDHPGTPYAGTAAYTSGRCTIAIAEARADDAALIAHEVGHCVDGHHLAWDHNGWRDGDGCAFGPHYCPAIEGYAEGYARAYTSSCGPRLEPFGLAPGPAACTLPEPRAIAPPTGPDPREIIPHLPRP